MGISNIQRYTLRRVLYIITAVLSVAGSGYAAVIAPLDARLDQLERKVADKSDAIARLAGQMDAIITYFRVPYTPPPAAPSQEP